MQGWNKGADIAAAVTLVLGDDGNLFDVTGTAAVTAIASKFVGALVWLRFVASFSTLTHHATDLVLITGATVAAGSGDMALFHEYQAGKWRMVAFQSASGLPLARQLAPDFTSAEQTITAAGGLTIAHGLTGAPNLIQAHLICKTGELGYSIGDELMYPMGEEAGGANNRGLSVVPDATNLVIRYGQAVAPMTILNKTTGVATVLTLANWKLVMKAWI